MSAVIKAHNLSKRYRIGKRAPNSLRDALAAAASLRRFRNGGRQSSKDIWALKDVSFAVSRGEVLGVIGRNGAGKSTLLKILSRITKPTKGHVELQGRVGSLLEVGTGFHSELTGRENIYLNGAILGMSKSEIKNKFDEIVAFAETEEFLDTPVKRYSSGMTVRLAFAVAAHLEPEILIIDEVLAVGDVAFQRKCLGKMNEVAQHGRTVLFVSHDLSAINSFCSRALLLHEGSLVMDGRTQDVTDFYLDAANKLYSPITWIGYSDKTAEMDLTGVTLEQEGVTTNIIDCRLPFTIKIDYVNKQQIKNSRLFLLIRNDKGEPLFTTSDYDLLTEPVDRRLGNFVSRVSFPGGLLKTGTYYGTVGADIKYDRIIFAANDAFKFDVVESGDDTEAVRHVRVGIIAPLLKWQTEESNNT